jgi:superfamily II DNA or RNA helicase
MSTAADLDAQIKDLQRQLAGLDQERAETAQKLRVLCHQREACNAKPEAIEHPVPNARVTSTSPAPEKIALFKSLFRGREDVFPRRWENLKTGKSGYAPACHNEWVRGICEKPRIKCGECPNQAFIPVTDTTIHSHLQSKDRISRRQTSDGFTAGVYPMLSNETCWFLAADFDKQSWARDATAFLHTCRERNVPAVLERSRSGNGGHVWIFFSEPVPASEARRLGSFLLTETMERRPDIGFDSYDRFFPSQDTMPVGGFGNLIALPLQKVPRESDNSVFVDDDLRPYEDQWALLSTIRRMTRSEVIALIEAAAVAGRILGVRLPSDDDDDEPWKAPPSRRHPEPPISGELPKRVTIVLGNQVYVDRSGLPPALVNRLIRLAAFQNPEFYAAQAMRLPTFGKPRIIGCAELFQKHVGLPRGCLDGAVGLFNAHGVGVDLRDERQDGAALETRFLGTLTAEQEPAARAILEHDTGVLAGTTAFGKTVVAAHVIAARERNTLVLVHRQQLLDQWLARLRSFLEIDPARIGAIGGGKRKPTGIIDVALIQSLVRKGEVADLVADYGHLIVDECHHLSAVSFEAIARQAKAKYVLGLSATVTRKDGHHPIIFMQCGPIRYRVDPRKQAARRPFAHRVILRQTAFHFSVAVTTQGRSIQELYAALARDKHRNDLIFDDILSALEAGRSPVVITERKDHLAMLADRLSRFARNVIVLRGGMGVRERREVLTALENIPDDQERVLVATGRYLGEGFDDARLDTLFLTMPISWRGTLAQYAGRLHRLHDAKQDVVVYDYVDSEEPMLAKMAGKRQAGYHSLGYDVNAPGNPVKPEFRAIRAQ